MHGNKFWMVLVDDTRGCTYLHPTSDSARTEAERLLRLRGNANRGVSILEAVEYGKIAYPPIIGQPACQRNISGKGDWGLMEVKVAIKDIENLKTSTSIKEEKDKDGEVLERRLVTKVQFECEADPSALANVHRLLASDSPVHVVIGSPQAVMEVIEREGAFAEV